AAARVRPPPPLWATRHRPHDVGPDTRWRQLRWHTPAVAAPRHAQDRTAVPRQWRVAWPAARAGGVDRRINARAHGPFLVGGTLRLWLVGQALGLLRVRV